MNDELDNWMKDGAFEIWPAGGEHQEEHEHDGELSRQPGCWGRGLGTRELHSSSWRDAGWEQMRERARRGTHESKVLLVLSSRTTVTTPRPQQADHDKASVARGSASTAKGQGRTHRLYTEDIIDDPRKIPSQATQADYLPPKDSSQLLTPDIYCPLQYTLTAQRTGTDTDAGIEKEKDASILQTETISFLPPDIHCSPGPCRRNAGTHNNGSMMQASRKPMLLVPDIYSPPHPYCTPSALRPGTPNEASMTQGSRKRRLLPPRYLAPVQYSTLDNDARSASRIRILLVLDIYCPSMYTVDATHGGLTMTTP
ncbi:hypothetical protein C8R46DRAFT_1223707 [Mycena filopes]|nr:hypothetical protein C8R46DRAFT_1223707 [Mycena filopes]